MRNFKWTVTLLDLFLLLETIMWGLFTIILLDGWVISLRSLLFVSVLIVQTLILVFRMKNFNKKWLKLLAIMHIVLLLLIFIVDLNGYIFQAANFDFTLYILMMCISFSFVMKESWIRWVITIVSTLILTSIFYFFVNIHPQNIIKNEFNQMLSTKDYKKMENLHLPGDMDYSEFLENLPSDARAKRVYDFESDESLSDMKNNYVVCTVSVKHDNKTKKLEIIIEQVNIWQWKM